MLSALIWLPVLGAALIGFWPVAIAPKQSRYISLAVAAVILVWTIFLGIQFNPSDIGLQFQEDLPWIEALGLSYRLGVDGLSFPLLALNSFLTCIAIYSTDESIGRSRFYYSLVLLLNAGVAGAFLSQDILL